ncbi:MAG: hypothetical protein F9K47_17040 [Burkholderiales bacterium]|nr:MAG: hypothetical protein F9K47_17040 [Burkholderiales bacterium]
MILLLLCLGVVLLGDAWVNPANSQSLPGTAEDRAKFRAYAAKNICGGQSSPSITYWGNPFEPKSCRNPDDCGFEVVCAGGGSGRTQSGPIDGAILGRPSYWQTVLQNPEFGPVVVLVLLTIAVIAIYFTRLGRKIRLATPAPREKSDEKNSRSARNYDAPKWNTLVEYDDDVSAAEKQIRPLGQQWIDELARSYLAVNDKSLLPKIVEKIEIKAAAESTATPPKAGTDSFREAAGPWEAHAAAPHVVAPTNNAAYSAGRAVRKWWRQDAKPNIMNTEGGIPMAKSRKGAMSKSSKGALIGAIAGFVISLFAGGGGLLLFAGAQAVATFVGVCALVGALVGWVVGKILDS